MKILKGALPRQPQPQEHRAWWVKYWIGIIPTAHTHPCAGNNLYSLTGQPWVSSLQRSLLQAICPSELCKTPNQLWNFYTLNHSCLYITENPPVSRMAHLGPSSLWNQGFATWAYSALQHAEDPNPWGVLDTLHMPWASIPLCLCTCFSCSPSYSPLFSLSSNSAHKPYFITSSSVQRAHFLMPQLKWLSLPRQAQSICESTFPTSSQKSGGYCMGFQVRWIEIGIITQTFSSSIKVGKLLSPLTFNNPYSKN